MQAQTKLVLIVAGIILPLATAAGPSSPVQPGAPADCTTWYTAKDGDTVIGISKANNIPLAAFMDANPQLAGDPLLLWRGYDYCVSPRTNSPPARGSGDNMVHALSEGYPTGGDYNPTFQGATGTGGPMQPANGTGYYPVSGAEAGNIVPHGPTNGRSKEAADPTAAPTGVTGVSADEPAALDSGDGSNNTSNDMDGIDSCRIGPSTMSNLSAAGPQSTASSQQSSESSQSGSSTQSSAAAEFATEPQPSPATQTTADSQSSQSAQSSAASPGPGSDTDVSTLTTAIVAPTPDLDQSGAQIETADGGETNADGLTQSFSAIPRGVMWGSYIDPSRMAWTQSLGKSYAVYQETVITGGRTSTSTITVWRWPNA